MKRCNLRLNIPRSLTLNVMSGCGSLYLWILHLFPYASIIFYLQFPLRNHIGSFLLLKIYDQQPYTIFNPLYLMSLLYSHSYISINIISMLYREKCDIIIIKLSPQVYAQNISRKFGVIFSLLSETILFWHCFYNKFVRSLSQRS